MKIYLLGYMGCGKTTAGKKLANKMGYDFIDLDDLLEKNQGRSISDIFSQEGEDVFRTIERQTLHSTFTLNNVVIATGGGAPCFFDNIEEMNKHGLTIYVDMTPKALVSRLEGQIEHRPILQGKSNEELLSFISEALDKRNLFYQKALTSVEGLTLSENSLLEAIESYNSKDR